LGHGRDAVAAQTMKAGKKKEVIYEGLHGRRAPKISPGSAQKDGRIM